MYARHLLTAAYSGLALIFMAALASAVRLTLNPEAASSSLMIAWISVNLMAWGSGWVTLRHESDPGFGELLVASGDLLLPLNLYMVGIIAVRPIAGSAALSASFAAMVALVYYIFADLVMQRIPLTGHIRQAYLFTVCFGVPVYFTHFTIGLSFTTVALMLVGLAGLDVAISRLLNRPLRRHYAVAGMLLIFAVVGLFARFFVQQPDGLLLLAIYLAAGLLLALTWLNQEERLGALLGFATWAVLSLALAATLYSFSLWKTPSLPIAAVWVALLMCVRVLVRHQRFAALKESAYWVALALGAVVVGFLWPLWRSLAMLHFAGLLKYRVAVASAPSVEMPPGNVWRVPALILIAGAWAAGIIIRRANRAPAQGDRPWAMIADNFIGAIPPLLLLAAISAGAISVFNAVSWVVALFVVTGAVYCWAGSQSERSYPSHPLTILGYIALGLAIITASFHLPTILSTLAAVAVILFIISELNDSLTPYVLCLISLTAGVLLVSFGVYPQKSIVALGLFYFALLLLAHWWIYRARGIKAAPFPTKTLISLTSAPTDPINESATEHVATKALITLTLTVLLAAFIIAASLVLRQFPPISFFIMAGTYALIRYAWEPSRLAPARRYAHVLWLLGSYLAHAAAGLLIYSLLRSLNISLDVYGVMFAGLSIVYLIGYGRSSGPPRLLTRMSLIHFVHYFSLLAVIVTVVDGSLGIKAVLAWLLVMVVHLYLSAGEETKWIYPAPALRVLGFAAVVAASLNLLWRNVPGLTALVPLPEVLTGNPSTLLKVSFLFALGLIFTILMNREKSLSQGLLALGFIATALALVAFAASPGSVPLYSSLLYVYLLVVSRVELRRTSEETFSPRLPQTILWLANGLLLLLLGISALQRQFDPLAFMVAGLMTLNPGWEQMLPLYVRQRFRLVLLTTYSLAHIAAAVMVYALLGAYGVTLPYYGLAFAALAGMHLLGYWLTRRRPPAPLRAKILWHVIHYLALLSLITTLGFASRSPSGPLATSVLALISLHAYWLSGRAAYKHVTAYLLIAAIALTGRTWGIDVLEFYLVPLAAYFGWVLYQGFAGDRRLPAPANRSQALAPPRSVTLLRVGLTSGLFLILIAYPAWRFATTGEPAHLIISGLGAVAAIHLCAIIQAQPVWIYLIGLVLILEAAYIIGTRQFDSLKVASLLIIGFLVIADLGYLAGRKSTREEKELAHHESASQPDEMTQPDDMIQPDEMI
jgi:hypothetical protein